MTRLTTSSLIEKRRPGLWIVAAGGRFFTVEIGLDRTTFEFFYRVSWGSRDAQFAQVESAFDFCRQYGLSTSGAAR